MLIQNPPVEIAEGLWMLGTTAYPIYLVRRTLATMHPVEAMEQLTSKLAKFKSNKEFIELIAGQRLDD